MITFIDKYYNKKGIIITAVIPKRFKKRYKLSSELVELCIINGKLFIGYMVDGDNVCVSKDAELKKWLANSLKAYQKELSALVNRAISALK